MGEIFFEFFVGGEEDGATVSFDFFEFVHVVDFSLEEDHVDGVVHEVCYNGGGAFEVYDVFGLLLG